MFAALLAALPLISVAAAQTPPTVHQVIVGGTDANNQITYQPPALSASIGDIVQFVFKQKNHTVTQTSFANVCHPLLDTTHKPVFDTDFMPVTAEQTSGFPTYNYTVTTTDAIWMYCRQKTHCGKGMVFSINCPATGDHSFENFKAAALAFGAAEASQAAAQSSWAATATSEVYGSQTYAPVWHPTVTQTVTLGSQSWTTVYESYANSPDATPVTPEGVEHRVIVGANGTLTYDPPYVVAAPRDTIVFEFQTKNHTATQSSFGNPCRKLEFTSTTGQKGFDSGFMPVTPGSTDYPTYKVKVNDTAPVWIYCRQTSHCGQGMVFAVNPDETQDHSFASFQTLATIINGTSSNSNSSNGQTSSNNKGAAPTIRASMASAALLVVGGLFVFVL